MAMMASLTIGAMSAQDVICNEQVALDALTAYIDTMRPGEQPDAQLPHRASGPGL